MLKNVRVRLLAGLISAVMAAPMAGAETLTDALIAAYRNSNLLEQNRATLRAADEDVAIAVASLRPALNYALTQTHARSDTTGVGNTTTASIRASWLLFDFGATKLGLEGQKAAVLATRQALLGVEQQVLLNTVSAYMGVRRAADVVRLRENNVRVITEQLRAAKDRFDVGEITRTDVSQAEASLALARGNLAAARGDFMEARELFRLSVGRYPGNLAPPPASPKTAASLDAARAVAVRTHPDILGAQHTVRVRELATEAAKRGALPELELSGSLGETYGTGTSTGSVTLELSGPLYSGGALAAAYRKQLATEEAARASLHQTVLTVKQGVANAWTALQVARAQLDASDRQIRAAEVAYRGVQEEARAGARTTLDVLNAEQDLLDAKTNRVTAETQAVTAVYSLLASMGLLTVDHLGLGIPTYDVTAYYDQVKTAPSTSVRGERLDSLLQRLGRK